MLFHRLAAVIIAALSLFPLAVPCLGQTAGDGDIRLALPSWIDSGDRCLAGLGGTMGAKPAGREFEKYIIRPSPGADNSSDNPAALTFAPDDWISHPLSSTRRPREGDDLFQYQLGAYRYRNKEYGRAAEAFLDLINRFRESGLRTKALFWLAASYYRSGDWEESEKSFRILLSGEARDWMRSTSLVALGWISQRRGRVEDALTYFRQFLHSYPDASSAPLVTFLLGDALYSMDRYDEAAEQFQRAYGAAPGGREKDRALYWWAESRRAAGAYAEATELYERYLRVYPRGKLGIAARYGIAWCALGDRKYDEAAGLFAAIPAQFPDSSLADESSYLSFWSGYRGGDWSRTLSAGDRILARYQASPWLGRVRFLQAMALFREDRFEESRLAFSRLLAEEGDVEAQAVTFMYAAALMRMKRYDEALAGFTRLVVEDSEQIRDGVYERIAWSSLSSGDLDTARRSFARALNRGVSHEESAEVHYWLGVIERTAGKAEKAVIRFGKALETLPEGDRANDALAAIAGIYFSQKKWREAGDVYLKLSRRPGENTFRDRAILRLAECRAAEGKGEEALQILVAFLGEEREESLAAQALYHVGRIHSKKKRFELARDELLRLIEEHPDNDHVDDAKYQIALGLYQEGRFKEAVDALEDLVSDHPDSSIIGAVNLKLGDATYRMRNFDKALGYYRSVIASGSDRHVPEAEYGINLIHLARGDFEEYRKGSIAFARKNRGNPLTPVVLYQLGRQLLLRENYAGAAKVFAVLVRDYPGREGWLHAMVSSARTYRKSSDRKELMTAVSSELATASLERVPLLRYRLALLHLEEENCREALADLLAAGTTGGEQPLQRFALFEAAGCLVSEGREGEAEEIYRRVLHAYPGTEMASWSRFVLGSLLFDRGEYADAAKEFGMIPAGGGELDAVAAFRIGRAFQFEGKADAAMNQFMLSLSLSPEGPLAQRASYRAAEIARQTGRQSLAESLYRKAISLGGDEAVTELSRDGLATFAGEGDGGPRDHRSTGGP